ncbi:12383_t:CDS:2 [Cetraspora pellucida]|uniref:12383_t:CDS:1 n=1 Tax=Cetraspora pellucida TaxID=1433469 RepID=A0ACA9KQP2_9GLOM|nr:12383_t:CDS:2 [Cetraspora pellucida]
MVSKDPSVKELEKKCAKLTKILTREQAMKFQEIIDEKFGNNKISDKQIPQALEFVLKMLENYKKVFEVEEIVYLSVDLPDIKIPIVTPKRKFLESYYISEVSGDDHKKEDLKQEQDFELNAKIIQEKLLDKVEKAEHKPSGLVNSKNGFGNKLEDLIDCYLEISTTWMPKSDILEELKPAEIKEFKTSDYHQKSFKKGPLEWMNWFWTLPRKRI